MPKNSKAEKLVYSVLFYLGLLLLWEGVARAGFFPRELLPAPSDVLAVLWHESLTGAFWASVASSLKRILLGYSIAVACGLAMGFGLTRAGYLQDSLSSLFLGMQAFPSICWVPVALLWFGVNDAAVIFVVVVGSVFAIAVATDQAIQNVPPIYVRAARTMGARGLELYARVIFPAAVPNVLYGLKLGWSYAWRTLIGSEIIIAGFGVGKLFQTAQQAGNMAEVFALNAVVMLVSIAVDFGLFGQVGARVRRRWGMAGAR